MSKAKAVEKRPSADWSDDQLAAYVNGQIDASGANEAQSIQLGRRSALELFRAGSALVIVRERHKKVRGYTRWLKSNEISPSTAHHAITLFEKAKTEKAVELLTITEAKVKFGIIAKPKKKGRKPPKVEKGVKGETVPPAASEPVPPKEPDSITRRLAFALQAIQFASTMERNGDDPLYINDLVDKCVGLLAQFRSVKFPV